MHRGGKGKRHERADEYTSVGSYHSKERETADNESHDEKRLPALYADIESVLQEFANHEGSRYRFRGFDAAHRRRRIVVRIYRYLCAAVRTKNSLYSQTIGNTDGLTAMKAKEIARHWTTFWCCEWTQRAPSKLFRV